MKSAEILMVYMTFASREEAEKIATLLVKQRLAACVNILGEIQSVYEWKGTIERSKEFAMIAKTTTGQYPALEQLIKNHHSYECPCIVAWSINRGFLPFLEWVKTNVISDR
jgi:periplasmic divalent cation tolerance protein